MDESEHRAVAGPWQALPHHDFKPSLLPRGRVGRLDVTTVDADRTQRVSLRQTKFLESRLD